MRSRWAICFAAFGMAYGASQPALNPFLDGIEGQAQQPNVESFYVRETNGTYIQLLFSTARPYQLLSSTSAASFLLMQGLSALTSAPEGPAGVGLQSQAYEAAYMAGTGGLAAALCGGNVIAVYNATTLTAPVTEAFYNIGQDANSVRFADFNGDGNQDLAVAYDGGGSGGGIAILLGKGDGTFGNAVTYAGGIQATRFAILDLNHDGVLDIAMASLSGTVAVILGKSIGGKGDGTFGSATTYPMSGSPQAITIADVNGDGNPDLVVGGSAGVLLGDGMGNFHPGTPLPAVASGTQIWAFAAGDLNGDGKIDLVFADISNQVMVPMLGAGDGTFQPGQAYLVSQLPDSIVLADYNNDGHLDIINAGGDQRLFSRPDESGDIDILIGNGDGTFQGAPAYFFLPNSEAASNFYLSGGLATGQFTGGSPGVLVSGFRTPNLTLFPGNGKGGLLAPVSIPFPGLGAALATADFNRDGKTDAAATNGSSVSIYLGNSTGLTAFGAAPSGEFAATAIATADFNKDGNPDLAVMGSGNLAILLGKGDGTFGAPLTSSAGVTTTSLTAADLNGDGLPDLIFADSGANGAGGVYVALNLGGGQFGSPKSVFSGVGPAFGVGDVNGDGKPDLVVAGGIGNGNSALSWLQGTGNGAFQAAQAITTSDASFNAILVQDFNSDGNADIAGAQQDGTTLFLAGNGQGGFSAATNLLGGGEPTYLASTDLNGDGRPDLVVAGFTVGVLLNQSTAAVPARVYSAANGGSTTLAPGSLASAFATDLANSSPGSTSLPLPLSFGGTAVSIVDSTGTSTPAPLLYVIPSQVNFEVPAGVANGPAQVIITSGDGTKSAGNVQIQPVAPGLFDFNSDGLAAAYVIVYHADGSNTFEPVYTQSGNSLVATPVSLGSATDQPYLFLFGTGIAAAGTSGVTVMVGGTAGTVKYAGAQGVYAGLDQVNVLLPQTLAGSGSVVVILTANGIAANAVNFSIQ